MWAGDVMFAWCDYYLTIISGGGDDGGRLTGAEAAKPMTRVWVCVSTFVTVNPLDSLEETMQHFQLLATKSEILSQTVMFSYLWRQSVVTREKWKTEICTCIWDIVFYVVFRLLMNNSFPGPGISSAAGRCAAPGLTWGVSHRRRLCCWHYCSFNRSNRHQIREVDQLFNFCSDWSK